MAEETPKFPLSSLEARQGVWSETMQMLAALAIKDPTNPAVSPGNIQIISELAEIEQKQKR